MTQTPLRVLIVEDHPVFASGLVALLDLDPDIVVAGVAADGPAALDRALPGDDLDVVVMDLNLPSMSGVEVTARLVAQPEPPAVLVVTMVDDDDMVLSALRAGARGYVLKGETGEQIVSAIRTVAAGGAVFGQGVASRVLALSRPQEAETPVDDGLTGRERQVLTLIAAGQANSEIARELGLNRKTVQNYVSRILDKLQVSDRTQAALRARDGGRQPG